jgi:hypothetical protein
MSTPVKLRRWIANVLVRRAAKLLPDRRAAWAQAMRQEVDSIDDDGAALRWALGCVRAGLEENMQHTRLLDISLVRWGIAVWAGLEACSNFFDACIVFAVKYQLWHAAKFLGGFTPGGDYRRIIALATATPALAPIFSVTAGVLYLIASVQLLRRDARAAVVFSKALMFSVVSWLVLLRQPLTWQAFSAEHIRRDAMLFALTAVFAVTLWQGRGHSSRSRGECC